MFYCNPKVVFFSLIFLWGYFFSFGQSSQEQFGKNRIQYKKFDWQYISTLNFDIFYYEGGKEIARNAANYAEPDFKRITGQTGFTPYSKIKIIVYNSVSDMQQSNIGLEDQSLVIGGQTNFVKSKIEVAFNGSQVEFKNDINFAVSAMLINVMLYGGSLKDVVQSSYLLSLPEWYVNGAAAYLAEGWSIEMDNYIRGIFLKKDVKKPSVLSGQEAIRGGQSIWNFIAVRYGRSSIANILNLTRIVRNEEASIESALGIPYYIFIREWRKYYSGMTNEVKDSYEELDQSKKITKNNHKDYFYKDPSISPDGKNIAYIKSYKGKYYVMLHDSEKNKNKKIYKGGHKLLHQKEDENAMLIAWRSAGELSYIEKRKNKLWLTFHSLDKGKKIKREIKEFNQVLSFSFSHDGEYIVFSAGKSGQSDIFLYDIKGNSFRQMTDDLYDDLDPRFLQKDYSIVLSSNRINDTLNIDKGSYQNMRNSYDIYLLETLTGNKKILKRLTDYSVNSKPRSFGSDNIIFLSEEKGISNLYKYNIGSGKTTQTSEFLMNIENFDADIVTGNLVITSMNNGKKFIYNYKGFDFEKDFDPKVTERQKLIDEKDQRRVKKDTIDPLVKDSLGTGEIDINEFQFDSDVKKNQKEKKTTITYSPAKALPLRDQTGIKGPSKYKNSFGIDKVNSTIMIDPLRGLGILMEVEMADMFRNHKMNAGVFGLTDLKSSNLFGEYSYLKKRVDFKIRYDRKALFAYNETVTHRYTLNKSSVAASYPFSESARISIAPFVVATRFTDLNLNSLFTSDHTAIYGGLRGEYIYDNTSVSGMNMIEGTRCKIGIEKYVSPGKEERNFGKFVFDLRHYRPIHKELVLATRFSYGQFFGNAKKNFLLGGMDNWLFNSTSHHGVVDPLNLSFQKDNSDLLFIDYVTNLRGFNYNTQFGPKYLLFNAELRIPIVKYLYNGVISSGFLKNLQLITFTDVGSSWAGKNPFYRDNSTNTVAVGGGSSPFSATVVNYKNPFLLGYGLGVRTLFLGYYVKFDAGWGVSDNKITDRRFYLTFGYDF
jgi:hypothetical protein